MVDAVIFGNVTLDILCQTVDEVPRYESITFENVLVGPGGCGSNVAVGLAALDVDTALVARSGADEAAQIDWMVWERFGIDLRYLSRSAAKPTGTSVGLIDSQAQPRFIHTSGANAELTVDALDTKALAAEEARWLHVAGFFVLPGLLDGRLPETLAQAKSFEMTTSLDVIRSPRMRHPELLWPSMPYLDVFLCNAAEAQILTGEADPAGASQILRSYGCKTSIIKLGDQGCWLAGESFCGHIPALKVAVVDTTGAGDAFAAGFIAAALKGSGYEDACRAGNAAGARIVGSLGAITGWEKI